MEALAGGGTADRGRLDSFSGLVGGGWSWYSWGGATEAMGGWW